MKHSIIKNNIQKSLFNKLKKINGIISVTLVGSFVNKNDLSGISDIDTVVICKSLNYKKFLQCQESVKEIDLEKCGLPDHRLKINNTFGPLKYDEKKIVVSKAEGKKCPRCWKILQTKCIRCDDILSGTNVN